MRPDPVQQPSAGSNFGFRISPARPILPADDADDADKDPDFFDVICVKIIECVRRQIDHEQIDLPFGSNEQRATSNEQRATSKELQPCVGGSVG